MISAQNVAKKVGGLDLAAIALTNMTRLYYHHEIKGLEKIPSSGAAILVYYHGVVLVDYVALVARLYMRDGRMVNSVVHKLLAALPGWERMERNLKLTAAPRDHYVSLLEAGELVGVAVGGAEEALFDWDYDLLWANRNGFAKLALATGAPIIPIFTENIREAFETVSIGGDLMKALYGITKGMMTPMMPIYGGLPVKLTTHVGDPIMAREEETADQLKERVEETMRGMIARHQVKGGGVGRAVLDRLKLGF